jgi:Zn ribbon nucleic-acid-binding protein
MAEEMCPSCGSQMEVVRMEDEDILRCTSCGYERPLIAVEPWDPNIDGFLTKYSIAIGIVLMIILWAIIYSTILVHYKG